jgi:hypothetical protein
MKHQNTILSSIAGIALAGTANAANINKNGDINASEVWTANNTYNLTGQVYIRNGATLTIEPGTVIASLPTPNGAGSLAITRGSRIIANGTAANPIIFTSTLDVATWVGGDPTTGTWRAQSNEWGNITLMGNAYMSNTKSSASNTPTFNANNVSAMEGLTPDFVGDPDTLYGGGDDDDDSGTLRYVSIRYGGRVIGLGNELNGLSLGSIGRATDIDHIEIMNNVDDGIEIWGGTVNLKYVSIWNVGDDSLDIDQGWRGKAQFGLIVQGYSEDAAQGSGIGDNAIEIDGAEKADAQPVTTATVYNFTVIGQPSAGDEGTAWRDGARVQFRNCIFMDLGEDLIEDNNTDGEGSLGYGFNGTLTFAQVWTTAYTVTSPVNAPPNPAVFYTAQSAGSAAIGQGKLAEITDSVFFRNLEGFPNPSTAYATANSVGVTSAGGSNPAKGNVVAAFNQANPNQNMPIAALTRAAPVALQGGTLQLVRVTSIDPRAANAAATSIASAPDDGFFTPASYRGAFSAKENWLCGWTAADAYGFNVAPPGGCVIEIPCPADITGNNIVDTDDLLAVINSWGTNGAGDITGNGNVDTDDLLAVINAWGACQ